MNVMNDLAQPAWIETIGLLGGVLGVGIAVWLQLIVQRRIRAAYVGSFLAFGWFMVITNLYPIFGPSVSGMVKLVAYSAAIVLQLLIGYRLYCNATDLGPASVMQEVYDKTHDR